MSSKKKTSSLSIYRNGLTKQQYDLYLAVVENYHSIENMIVIGSEKGIPKTSLFHKPERRKDRQH